MIIFGSVQFLSKKKTKSKFKKKKTKNGLNRPVSIRFFRTKTGSSQFSSVFSVWLDFFPVWVQFGFLGFRFIKPNQPVF